MSKRNKLQKFEDLRRFENVIQNFDAQTDLAINHAGLQMKLKGKWHEEIFKNKNPIVLELACGRGEYTIGLAKMFSNKNFIGIDIKGARIWQGAVQANNNGLKNVMFFRCQIEQISKFFEKGEVDEIWITFPDPFLKKTKSNRRLTSAKLIKEYLKIVRNGGLLHLKTDSRPLYNFTLEEFHEIPEISILYYNDDIYAEEVNPMLSLKTFYEKMHLENNLTIKYIQARLN